MKTIIFPIVLILLAIFIITGYSKKDGAVAPPKPGIGFTPDAITLKEVAYANLKELMDERLVFIDSAGVEWVAPKGTLTDGASVPRMALWVTDGRFDSQFLKAAVIHDAYCQAENAGRCPEQYRTRPWKEVHRMFYQACLTGGTPPTKARIMFAAVWLAGPRWNDPARSLDGVPDDKLYAEFELCKKWIEKTDPTIAQIEKWMEKHEEKLLAEQ